MKYLLSVYGNDKRWEAMTPAETETMIAEDAAFQAAARASGELVTGYGLAGSAGAVVVHRDGAGTAKVEHGRYLAGEEYLACFFVVDVVDHARAVELAAGYPAARDVGVEVWPLFEGSA